MILRPLILALLAVCASGCASWDTSKFDPSRLRDPRATDLDQRLSSRPELVASPFGPREEE